MVVVVVVVVCGAGWWVVGTFHSPGTAAPSPSRTHTCAATLRSICWHSSADSGTVSVRKLHTVLAYVARISMSGYKALSEDGYRVGAAHLSCQQRTVRG